MAPSLPEGKPGLTVTGSPPAPWPLPSPLPSSAYRVSTVRPQKPRACTGQLWVQGPLLRPLPFATLGSRSQNPSEPGCDRVLTSPRSCEDKRRKAGKGRVHGGCSWWCFYGDYYKDQPLIGTDKFLQTFASAGPCDPFWGLVKATLGRVRALGGPVCFGCTRGLL